MQSQPELYRNDRARRKAAVPRNIHRHFNVLEVSADEILCGAVKTGYAVKESKLASKLENISAEDKMRIYEVVDVLIRHSKKKK